MPPAAAARWGCAQKTSEGGLARRFGGPGHRHGGMGRGKREPWSRLIDGTPPPRALAGMSLLEGQGGGLQGHFHSCCGAVAGDCGSGWGAVTGGWKCGWG
eukprot:CAMPEP_0174346280 /NCGR_PEP_ID=MMETSP0811_2-20130205/1918_1 /TAXON_ID=73025 ORGANISM="Eutreptiella gymnastica-like, Strain CCMP1594" /NCGR_SAMPLE_ID=MMETSP0811_2 /ASSEMBLY_ACC=CAM_ASM_000667 /LENGTH=99 /DNA_ID=CAMNT_0015470689 /DNA_START=43 /DNA_END=338 /DNA_ORIENTATION=-